MTKAFIAEKVRQELQGIEVPGVTLQVDDEDVYQVEGYWRVPVRPTRWPARMFDFYEALATANVELQDAEHLNIVLEAGDVLDEEYAEEKPGAAPAPEMREQYEFENGQRGQDAHLFPQEPQVVVLSPDVAAVFPGSASVNEALRVLVKAAQASVPMPQEREAA